MSLNLLFVFKCIFTFLKVKDVGVFTSAPKQSLQCKTLLPLPTNYHFLPLNIDCEFVTNCMTFLFPLKPAHRHTELLN